MSPTGWGSPLRWDSAGWVLRRRVEVDPLRWGNAPAQRGQVRWESEPEQEQEGWASEQEPEGWEPEPEPVWALMQADKSSWGIVSSRG